MVTNGHLQYKAPTELVLWALRYPMLVSVHKSRLTILSWGQSISKKKKVMTSGRYTSRHRASPFDIGEVVVMCTMWCNSIWDRGCKPIRIVELHPAKLHLVTPKYTKRRTTPYFGIVFPLEV